jgi:hypothetical protein
MRGLLYIRLFFAFVPRSASGGKRRIFFQGTNTVLFKAMPHCAWNQAARQSKCLCIASEISAKLFSQFSTQNFLCLPARSALGCGGLREPCIKTPGVNPQ